MSAPQGTTQTSNYGTEYRCDAPSFTSSTPHLNAVRSPLTNDQGPFASQRKLKKDSKLHVVSFRIRTLSTGFFGNSSFRVVGKSASRCRSLRKSATTSSRFKAKRILNTASVEPSPVSSSREIVAAGTPLRRASSVCVQRRRCRSVLSQPRNICNASSDETSESISNEFIAEYFTTIFWNYQPHFQY